MKALDKELSCAISGCAYRRPENAPLCVSHWKRLSAEEQREWSTLLYIIASWATVGDSDKLNAAVDNAWAFLSAKFAEEHAA